MKTTYESFLEGGIAKGHGVLFEVDGSYRSNFKVLKDLGDKYQLEFKAGYTATAEPGLPMTHDDYLILKSEILEELKSNLPVDMVFLNLHGAMMSDNCHDCEGDILESVRAIVGSKTPIGAVLDPHAHLTKKMVEAADVLSFMKEYPHIDGLERTNEVLNIITRIKREGLRLKAAVVDCQIHGFFPTQDEPMRGFVDSLFEDEEKELVESISFVHGFPWGENDDLGAKVLVYTNNDANLARNLALDINAKLQKIRDKTGFKVSTIDEAISSVSDEYTSPLLIADVADNPGGGAPSDSTFILQALIDNNVENVSFGFIYSPEVIEQCRDIDCGASFKVTLGGRLSPYSGKPVSIKVKLVNKAFNSDMDVLGLVTMPMGDTVWLEYEGINIFVNNLRVQPYAPSAFDHLGIDLGTQRAIVVKSTNHFVAAFKPISERVIYVNTPGTINYDFNSLIYKSFSKPFYPKNPELSGFLAFER